MKTMIRSGKKFRRGVSLLLMMSLLIALLPAGTIASAEEGPYGTCTVTSKNVVIRSTPAGSRTGYFAQKGEYPMIGPVVEIDGVKWYNIRTGSTTGYVSGKYATASYGSAGMPHTDKIYVDVLGDTTLTKGADPANPEKKDDGTGTMVPITVTATKGSILQLVDGDKPYTVVIGGSSVEYINLYYNYEVYHAPYVNNIANGVMSTDNLDNYITSITWKQTITVGRNTGAKGDYLTHAMQAALAVLDYYDDDVDGNYGSNTAAAVLEFKQDMIDDGWSWTANGVAGAAIFKPLFDLATSMLEYIRSTSGLGGNDSGSTTTSMIKTTVDKLRIRKSYTTSSTYVGIIPIAGTILTYTRTHVSGTVTWYYIQYNGTYGWVMGTYVEKYTPSSGSSGSTSKITNFGTVKITKKLVAIRVSPNGSRTGYHVNTGDVCTMIGPAVKAGGYTWYHIRTENGREGYVRGDCADADFDSSAGMPKTSKVYVQFLYENMEVTPGSKPSAATGPAVKLPQNTVLQLATGVSYKEGDVEYINVYYKNTVHFTRYTNDLTKGIMSSDNMNNYIINTIWAQGLASGDVCGDNDALYIRTGDIRVQAIQAALYQLDYMDNGDKFDGIFGSATADAVKKFKTDFKSSISTVNERIDANDSVVLFTAAAAALAARLVAAGGTDTGDGTVPPAGNFGTVNTVKRGSWSEIDGGATSLFPKGSVATVMSVNTKQVFRLYRWSGGNHADCVTYDTSDTATLCSVLGVTYNVSPPSSSELSLIKAAGNDDWPDYTWPKLRWDGIMHANADKIPVWVNLNGTVYCASIYVIPHGFTGTSAFSKSTRNGKYYYDLNNMYGMLCVHFFGSTTHASGTVNATHMSNINYAYNKAASYFGSSKVQ